MMIGMRRELKIWVVISILFLLVPAFQQKGINQPVEFVGQPILSIPTALSQDIAQTDLPVKAVQGRLFFHKVENQFITQKTTMEATEISLQKDHATFDILSLYRQQLNEAPLNELDIPEGCEVVTNREFEEELFSLINKERMRLGLVSLTWNEELSDAARKHSADMACNNFFSHTNLANESFEERIGAEGYDYFAVGEDLYAGDDAFNTPLQAYYGWFYSIAHYRVMTHPGLREVGIGYIYVDGSRYGGYFTADFGTQE